MKVKVASIDAISERWVKDVSSRSMIDEIDCLNTHFVRLVGYVSKTGDDYMYKLIFDYLTINGFLYSYSVSTNYE